MKRLLMAILAVVLISTSTGCTGTIGQSESEDFNQEVADCTVSMLNDYYQGMREGDFDLTFKNYATFYVNNVELELEYYGGSESEYISEDNATYYTENYGEDTTIVPEVTATTLMTKAVTKKYNKLVTDLYQEDATIQNVYTVYVNKVITGEIKSETVEEVWTVLEIDDNYYLYDDYFEQMAEALKSSSS